MFIEIRSIEIGENWFNKNSEDMVVVNDVFLEKSVIQVDYTYLEGNEDFPYYTCDLEYFLKEYIRTPYNINEGDNMNNTYSKDYDGTPMLTLNYDGSMSADIAVENGRISIFSSYDGYDCNRNIIPPEGWEQVKEFVDSQIESTKN